MVQVLRFALIEPDFITAGSVPSPKKQLPWQLLESCPVVKVPVGWL
jgi:hypothetical protein